MGDKEDDQSPHRHFVPVVDSCCSVALNVLQRFAILATDPAQHRHLSQWLSHGLNLAMTY